MRSNTVERVTEWDSEPFTGGHDGLRELADREFSGAATDGTAWLFMLNGRVLGCFDGDIDSFATADGTAYEAPDPSLPLLFAMQEQGGETRAEYYTEDTSISEVNQTLESGNFTGYVELSENVLSGDYYIAYYGGRSLPVAFVGNQNERLTGDEAFERADDEVGIYQVNTVTLDITDIPGGASDSAAGGVGAADESEEPATSESAEPSSTLGADATAEEPVEEAETESVDTAAAAGSPAEAEREAAEPTDRGTDATSEREPTTGSTAERATEPAEDSPAQPVTEAESTEPERDEGRSQAARRTDQRTEQQGEATQSEPGTAAEQRWRGAKTIPALDPSESVDMSEEVPGGVDEEAAAAATTAQPRRRAENEAAVEELKAERDRLQARVEELETEATELRSETDRLQEERNRVETERDEAEAQVAELENEVEDLRATVDRLESELASAESELADVEQYIPEGDHDVSVDRALDGTNLFVRYDRKGGATLEDAHDGNATREEVNDNLRLEHHTDFEDEGAVVEGEPFTEWLHETMEYGFGRWLVQEFVHDILETGNRSSMRKLFDAIPEIDRVEFNGTVDLPTDEEEAPETATFDVVLRDRMGNPLVVADLNDSREPATESMLGTLLENATPVAQAEDTLSSAFFVTTSYYNPDALETAEEATGGGFLSRDKSKSFVKLSRKGGYHLCLVETRDGEFHVSVPEL